MPEFSRRDASLQLSTLTPTPHAIDLQNVPLGWSDAKDSKHQGEAAINITSHTTPDDHPKRILLYGAVAIILVILLGLGAFEFVLRIGSTHSENTAAMSPQNSAQLLTPVNAARVPLRLLVGYQGSPKIDSAGAYWEADRYFAGGGAFERPHLPVSG